MYVRLSSFEAPVSIRTFLCGALFLSVVVLTSVKCFGQGGGEKENWVGGPLGVENASQLAKVQVTSHSVQNRHFC